jgi:ADP-ribose pyrophosphatase YjhB (NUDIX family)
VAISPYVRELRAAVGHRRLLMPSVGAIIRDGDRRLLLVRQRDDGAWSTPGGSIELDETPAAAVEREVREETGLVVAARRIFGVYGGPHFVVCYPNGDETQYISTMFECEILTGTPAGDNDETDAAAFWSLDDASRLRLSPWLIRVLPRLYEAPDHAWFEASDTIARAR